MYMYACCVLLAEEVDLRIWYRLPAAWMHGVWAVRRRPLMDTTLDENTPYTLDANGHKLALCEVIRRLSSRRFVFSSKPALMVVWMASWPPVRPSPTSPPAPGRSEFASTL